MSSALKGRRRVMASGGHSIANLTRLTALLLVGANACDFEHDVVRPGYYGETARAGYTATPPSSTGTEDASVGPAPRGSSVDAAPTPIPARTSPAADCDLSGRWLSTLHQVTDALGQLQTTHKLIYYEIEQFGEAFVVRRGMQCLVDTIAEGAFAITADFSRAWPALMRRVVYAGRTGTSRRVANGCAIDVAKLYTVYGATLPHYLNPSIALPSAEHRATDTKPGWEDWDGDGSPGITTVISGAVAGKLFVASREWTSMSGTVPNVDSVFDLPLQWKPEQNVMAFDGSPLLTAEGVRASDPTLHFAQFARLRPDQAIGDDEAICASIRKLAPELTPKAAGL